MTPRPPGPDTLAIAAALDRSEPLARLLAQLRRSRLYFDEAADLLPASLRDDTRAGPAGDDGQWTLLAAHGAAAAKLRQLLPTLLQALQARGHAVRSIRVRVQPREHPAR